MIDNDPSWGEFHYWNWNGFKCHWRVIGEFSNPPIVFVHGFGASSSHWRKNVNSFVKSGYRVYGLDLIGFGLSEQPEVKKQNRLDNFFWSKQLIAFLEEIVIRKTYEKTILVGNSLGSLVSITAVSSRRDLIKAVVASPLPDPALMQSIDFAEFKVIRKFSNFLIKLFFQLLPLELIVPIIARTVIIKSALQFAYHHSVKNDLDLLRIVSTPAKRITAPRALRAMCIGMSLRPPSYKAPFLLKKLSRSFDKCPILLLWGEKDKLVPMSIGKSIVKDHPWLQLLVIEDSGHCVHDETPDRFNENVLSWLNKLNFSVNAQN